MSTTYFSLELSITFTLLAAALWGSWMQIIKHLDDYPLSGTIFWLYTFSFIVVWGITLIVSPFLLPDGIMALITEYAGVIPRILVAGGIMSLGLYLSLFVMGRIGLVLSTTVGGGVGTLLGIATSLFIEGMPQGANAGVFLVTTTLILIAAGVLSSYASQRRDKEQGVDNHSGVVTARMVFLMLASAVLTNGWVMGTSQGVACGLPPVFTVVLMATGSFLSVALICSIEFTMNKRWKRVFCIGRSKKPLVLTAISAVCHYGGNLISIYSMPAISATISFLLGKSSSLWTIFWGLIYREFEGASRKTRIMVYLSVLLYFAGVIMLAGFKFQ